MPTHTLLRYPGGKSRAIKYILPILEKTGKRSLVSPFFGGGAVELKLVSKGWEVFGYDGWKPVVNFWQKAKENPGKIANMVDAMRPVSNEAFSHMQKIYGDVKDLWEQAAIFYTLNRCVHTGTGLSGGKTNWGDGNPRLTDSTVKKLRTFEAPSFSMELKDFADSLVRHQNDVLIYADPPYFCVGKTLYDHNKDKEFDHFKLFNLLNEKPLWVLSYNDVPEIVEMYKEYTVIRPEWKYGIKRNNSSELLILSKEMAKYAQ